MKISSLVKTGILMGTSSLMETGFFLFVSICKRKKKTKAYKNLMIERKEPQDLTKALVWGMSWKRQTKTGPTIWQTAYVLMLGSCRGSSGLNKNKRKACVKIT